MSVSRTGRCVVTLSVVAGWAVSAGAAPVSWTGLGDGVSWNDGLNWSSGVVPGAADDVTVDVPGAPAIVVGGANVSMRSLVNAEAVQISSGVTFTVLTTAASTGVVTVSGGTVSGGSWTFTGAGAFQTGANSVSTFSGATIAGEVQVLGSSSRVRMLAGSGATMVRLRGVSASVAYEPGATVTGQIISDGTSGGSFVEMTAIGTLTVAPGAVIGMAPGSGMNLGVLQGFWFGSGHLDLRGTIFNDAGANRVLTVRPRTMTIAATGRIENNGAGSTTLGAAQAPNTWTNGGTLAVSAGVMTLSDGWTNAGTLSVTGTGRMDLDGNFTSAGIGTIARSGGSIGIRGAWNNAGGYVLNASTGSFVLQGGVITGGSLGVADGSVLDLTSQDNQLNGVAYGGEIVLSDANDRVRFGLGTSVAGVRLQGTSTAVGLAAGTVVNYPIIAEGTATGSRFIEVSGGSGPLTIGPSGSVTMAGTFTSGTLSIGQAFWFGSATTVTNNGTVTALGSGGATTRTLAFGGSSLVNNGSVSASGGANLDVTPSVSVTNAGTISGNTGTVTIGSAWSSTGSISTTNGTLALAGTFNSASAGTVSRSGGTVDVTGVWSNTGSTFVFTAGRGEWNLRGGTVQGGVMDFDGGRLAIASAANTLDGVTFLDEVSLEVANSRARVMAGTTATAFRLRGSSAALGFGPGFVLACPVVCDMPSNGSCFLEGTAAGVSWTIGPAGSVTTAPGNLGTFQVGGVFWFGRPRVTNQGSISMSSAGRTMTIGATAFTNSGSIAVTAGAIEITDASGPMSNLSLSGAGSSIEVTGTYALGGTLNINPGTTLTLAGSWSNTGVINLNAGTLNLGGAFTLATLGGFTNTGGTVNITGALDNTGGTLALTPATGSWRLVGGSITGGTVTQTGGASLVCTGNSANLLHNVSLPQELALLEANGRVRFTGTTAAAAYRLVGNTTSIAFAPGSVVNTTITAEGSPGGRFIEASSAGTLTLGSQGRIVANGSSVSLTVGSFWFTAPALLNQGVVEKTGSGSVSVANCANLDPGTRTLTGGVWRLRDGSTLNLPGGSVVVNNATVELYGAGSLADFATVRENNGVLRFDDNRDAFMSVQDVGGVSSFINRGTLTLGAGSRMQLGSSTFASSFTQTASGVLDVELGGESAATGFGSLRVFGPAALDGTVRARYVDGFARGCGQVFAFLDANSRAGQFASADIPPVDEATLFLLFYGGADARFSVSARADFNQDGFLDFFDYDDFVNCFESGVCPPGVTADFNGDEFVDFFDYDDFVFRFEAGC